MSRRATTRGEAADFIAPEAISAKRKVRRGLEQALFFSGAADAFVRATEVWLGLIRAGGETASAPFQAWAEAPGQGRFGG